MGDAVSLTKNPNQSSPINLLLGDGVDGDVTITVNTALARTMYYHNLTINVGTTLAAQGCRIYVSGTLTNNGTISYQGSAGGNAVSNIGGAPGFDSGIDIDVGGVAGGGGLSVNDGDQGGSGNMGGASGASGNGGNGSINPAGAGQASVQVNYAPNRLLFTPYWGAAGFATLILGGSGGSGGGGGGDDGLNPGGGGGGGGAGGCYGYIAARNLIIGVTGLITANGGRGGNGADATVGNSGGGGGGSGGGGGILYLIYASKTNNGSITMNGGVGGTGGVKHGVGSSNGVAGSAGSVGNKIEYNISTDTWS